MRTSDRDGSWSGCRDQETNQSAIGQSSRGAPALFSVICISAITRSSQGAGIRREVSMNPPFAPLIDRLAKLRVLVIGEAMLDCYLEGSTDRICQEAPVPIVAISRRIDAPGGAANSAVNAAALGAEVRLLSAIGDDREGQVLRDALE